MAEFDIPPKQNQTQQILLSVLALVVVSALVAIFAKLLAGIIIFLIGIILGIGNQVLRNNPLE